MEPAALGEGLALIVDFPLQALHTLASPAYAEQGRLCPDLALLQDCLRAAQAAQRRWCVIGEGSNIVAAARIHCEVLVVQTRGITLQNLPGEDAVLALVEAGENWSDLVYRLCAEGLWGLENLALIPGTAGAAPVQNIGAYGVELKDCLQWLDVFDPVSNQTRRWSVKDCGFGYRNSRFKQLGSAAGVIVRIALKLSRRGCPKLEYAPLRAAWEQAGAPQDPAGIAALVSALRRAKLPDPKDIPNAGSFFKNPEVDASRHLALKAQFPELVSFPTPAGSFKLAAGWMIEHMGFRGHIEDGVGWHAGQALVLVNPGRRSAEAILGCAQTVSTRAEHVFGVRLEREPILLH